MNSELKNLIDRQRNIIIDVCNKIGCTECHLKWDGGCVSNELSGKISTLESSELDKGDKQ